MRVERIGAGTPAVAAVGAIHGDEPCGARAIERFLEDGRDVERPVKLILANERALDRGVRYTERDLNRSFPGDPDSKVTEERLAHALVREVEDCLALGFHSTVSTTEAFGTVADLDRRKRAVFRALPVDAVADFTGVVENRSVTLPGFLNVEAGYQGSQAAAENAYDCLLAFLRATGVLAGTVEETGTTVYEVFETITKEPGRSYRVLKPNFERVAPGEAFAEVDGDPLRAEREFWPVLMSAEGHSTLLGYRARRAGPIEEVSGGETEDG